MSQESRRAERIKRILQEAARQIDEEDVPVEFYFGALIPSTGKLYSLADITGDNMCKVLDCFFEKPQDLRNLAIYVNGIIKRRLAEGLMSEVDPPSESLDPDIQTN